MVEEGVAQADGGCAGRDGMEGPDFVSMRGAGNEEVIVAATPRDGATFVTGSTYYYDQQLTRFLASLPAPDGSGAPLIPVDLPESSEAKA